MAQNNNELATNITARINVMEAVPNIDINYGPYSSVHEAYTTLEANGAVVLGMTVGIKPNDSNTIQEYWFKSGTTEADLVEKLADQAIAAALSNHTSNTKIHVPMTYGGTTTAITSFKIEGEKMTITVGASEYAFRLTEWHDIPDFYVLYGNVTYENNTWKVKINNTWVDFSSVTGEDIMTLAITQQESDGYMVLSEKETWHTTSQGDVQVDYHKFIENNTNVNAMFVLYKFDFSKWNFAIVSNSLQSSYIYNIQTSVNEFNPNMVRNNIKIGETTYSVRVYRNLDSSNLDNNEFGINFNK